MKIACILWICLINLTTASLFKKHGITEMNNLNSEPLFNTNKFMLGYFSDGSECDEDCLHNLNIMVEARVNISDRENITLVWVNTKENRRVAKNLRIADIPSIAYLANNKAVVYQGDYESEDLNLWLRKRIILPSEPFSSHDELDALKLDKNRVVVYAGARSKYYQRFRYVASSYSELSFAHSFSAPVFSLVTQDSPKHEPQCFLFQAYSKDSLQYKSSFH